MKPIPLLACLCALMAGCSSPNDDGPAPAAEGPAGQAELANATIHDVSVVATMVEQTAVLHVPASTGDLTRIWFWFQANEGVWTSFQLSGLPAECLDVATVDGLTVSGGTNNGSGGSTCLVPPGEYTFGWKVQEGTVSGRIVIKAEVPA